MTLYDLKLIDTGFTIFLIFKQFEDILPNHPKIKLIERKNIDIQKYKKLAHEVKKEGWFDINKDLYSQKEMEKVHELLSKPKHSKHHHHHHKKAEESKRKSQSNVAPMGRKDEYKDKDDQDQQSGPTRRDSQQENEKLLYGAGGQVIMPEQGQGDRKKGHRQNNNTIHLNVRENLSNMINLGNKVDFSLEDERKNKLRREELRQHLIGKSNTGG